MLPEQTTQTWKLALDSDGRRVSDLTGPLSTGLTDWDAARPVSAAGVRKGHP